MILMRTSPMTTAYDLTEEQATGKMFLSKGLKESVKTAEQESSFQRRTDKCTSVLI